MGLASNPYLINIMFNMKHTVGCLFWRYKIRQMESVLEINSDAYKIKNLPWNVN